MLFAVRGVIGWLLVPGLMAVITYVALTVHEQPQRLLLTYIWVWFLLIAPVEQMFVFMRHKIYDNPESDSGKLRSLTLLPSAFWGVVFLAGTVAALVYGGAMLLRIEL
jgi:Peptidase M50B-like